MDLPKRTVSADSRDPICRIREERPRALVSWHVIKGRLSNPKKQTNRISVVEMKSAYQPYIEHQRDSVLVENSGAVFGCRLEQSLDAMYPTAWDLTSIGTHLNPGVWFSVCLRILDLTCHSVQSPSDI